MTDRMQRAFKIAKSTAFGLAIFFAAWAVYLIIQQQNTIETLVDSESDQDKVLTFLSEDNDSDECRDRMEQEFLSIIGTIIVRRDSEGIDKILIDRLTNTVNRLDKVDELCPAPDNPEPSDESG